MSEAVTKRQKTRQKHWKKKRERERVFACVCVCVCKKERSICTITFLLNFNSQMYALCFNSFPPLRIFTKQKQPNTTKNTQHLGQYMVYKCWKSGKNLRSTCGIDGINWESVKLLLAFMSYLNSFIFKCMQNFFSYVFKHASFFSSQPVNKWYTKIVARETEEVFCLRKGLHCKTNNFFEIVPIPQLQVAKFLEWFWKSLP